jgi:hypothetical protein
MMLGNRTVEVAIYPSDISISGKKADLARARAAVASRLTSTAAHLTTSKESQAVEDRLEHIAASTPVDDAQGRPMLSDDVRAELRSIDETLAHLDVEYSEWEVLYRMRLQVERDLLAGAKVGEAFPGQRREVPPVPAPVPQPNALAAILGGASIVLVALDVCVALLERLRPTSR